MILPGNLEKMAVGLCLFTILFEFENFFSMKKFNIEYLVIETKTKENPRLLVLYYLDYIFV